MIGFFLLGTALASSGILTQLWVSVAYTEISPGKAEALSRAEGFIAAGFLIVTLLAGATLALVFGAQKGKSPSWFGS